jgi:UDP-N-acetylglucosamine 2-epimerase
MMISIEQVLLRKKPDWPLVYGDTNSTLAGGLSAVKLGISLAHVESGLRSYNRRMLEEHKRMFTDYCADLLLCPTETAAKNLALEGMKVSAACWHTMFDAVLQFSAIAWSQSTILGRIAFNPTRLLRSRRHIPAYNTDIPENMDRLCKQYAGWMNSSFFLCTRARVGYLNMPMLEQSSRMIRMDSGGIQKEGGFVSACASA